MSEHMTVASLARFQPLNALNPDNLQALSKQLEVEEVAAGRVLFNKGDTDNTQIYLVRGEVDLYGNSGVLKTIKSGNPDSFDVIAHILPRTVTAKTKSDCTILKTDGNLVDLMLTWDQTGNYQISEQGVSSGSVDDDWMNRILQTEAFHRIPPANIQAIFMRMESVPVKAGDNIIKQGDDGDYFYVIKKGRCLVTRSMPDQPKAIKLAELRDGDTFGEEALISDSKRNASVTMLSEGVLSRLSKQDFLELLNEPLLDRLSFDEARKIVDDGGAWLDVRLPAESRASTIRGALSIPLIFLRMKADTLDVNRSYIVYCDTGRRSSAASFLLNERGFTTYILKDGIGAVPEDQRTG